MKGQTLKEALEYNPQPKKKFSTLSQEDRVKRLKQELADMEKLMRTGIGSSSLASGPSSAPADDEYVPQPPIPLPKKVKKPKKRERPPPPPPKKEMITLPLTSGIPPPPSGPPPKRVKEAKPEVDVPPPPPPRTIRVEKPTTENNIVEPVELSAEPQPPSPPPVKQNSPVRKREPSFSKDPIKKRILNDFPTDESSDPFDSFGAAGPTRPPQRKQIVQNDISDSEFGPPLPDIESTKSEAEPNDEDEWIVKPQSLKRKTKVKTKKEKKEKRKKDTEK